MRKFQIRHDRGTTEWFVWTAEVDGLRLARSFVSEEDARAYIKSQALQPTISIDFDEYGREMPQW